MGIYCVYVTFYSGNKLPPFYIGSTKVERILQGYKGSVGSKEYEHLWKTELKCNPHLFKIKILSYHETRKEAYSKECFLQESTNVVNNPLYINKSIANKKGIFGGGFKGHKHTLEHKKSIQQKMKGRDVFWLKGKSRPRQSELMLGSNNPMYGKKRTDLFCCIHCKKETIMRQYINHSKCVTLSSTFQTQASISGLEMCFDR